MGETEYWLNSYILWYLECKITSFDSIIALKLFRSLKILSVQMESNVLLKTLLHVCHTNLYNWAFLFSYYSKFVFAMRILLWHEEL